mmetsp:Transcript_8609/g.27406  ORF Transcript_8609/g.27406 Transcript_8609/m.27406 type:complete len:460 (-) Transcript_8609:55-1434(-)
MPQSMPATTRRIANAPASAAPVGPRWGEDSDRILDFLGEPLELRLLARRVPLRPSRQLLARDHLEARVAAQDLVEEPGDAALVSLDLALLAVVQLGEAQALVRVEDHCGGQLGGVEEGLELRLHLHVHPHPLHLRAPVAELRGELLGEAGEHVGLRRREVAVLQVDHAQALTLEADVRLGLGGELRHLLHEPRLGLLDGLLALAARAASDLVAHAGLREDADPVLQGQELHLPAVGLLHLGLGAPLHHDGGEFLDLELLDELRVFLRHEPELDGPLEDRLAGEGLPDGGRGLLVGEEHDLRLRGVRRDECVDVLLCEPRGHVHDEPGDLPAEALRLEFALVLEGRHRVRGVDHDGGRLLHAVLLTEDGPLRAADGADLGHALHVRRDLVVLVQERLVLLPVLLVEPEAADGAVAELGDDPIKVARRNALDVVLHGLDLDLRGAGRGEEGRGRCARDEHL